MALDHLEEELQDDHLAEVALDPENLKDQLQATKVVKEMFKHVFWKDKCSVCRGKIKEAIDIIMTKDNADLITFVDDFRKEFNSMTPEQISFPRSCNNLAKYRSSSQIFIKGTPIHVKGALIYNHQIKKFKITNKYPTIQEGDKIKFIKLKEINPFKFDVISYMTKLPREFELEKYIDRDMQFQKTFITPLNFILEAIGWDYEKKASLEAFFG